MAYKKVAYYIIDEIYSNKIYKFLIWLIILVMTYFTVIKYTTLNIFYALGLIISDCNFLCLCYFNLSLFLNKKVVDFYNDNMYLKIRLNNEETFNKEENKVTFFTGSVLFVLILIILIIMINIFSSGNYDIIYLENYKMNSISFMLYNILKIYIFMVILLKINTYAFLKIKSLYVYIFNSLFYFLILLNSFVNNSLISYPISYFIGPSIVNTSIYSKYYYDIINYLFHTFILVILYKAEKGLLK